MSKDNAHGAAKRTHGTQPTSNISKGDDTMSAATVNYVYKVVATGKEKPIPAITTEKLQSFKNAVEKYLKQK